MGAFSLGHLLVILLVVVIVFGVGKLPRAMGDIGKGLRNMREGLKGEDEPEQKSIASKKDENTDKSA